MKRQSQEDNKPMERRKNTIMYFQWNTRGISWSLIQIWTCRWTGT